MNETKERRQKLIRKLEENFFLTEKHQTFFYPFSHFTRRFSFFSCNKRNLSSFVAVTLYCCYTPLYIYSYSSYGKVTRNKKVFKSKQNKRKTNSNYSYRIHRIASWLLHRLFQYRNQQTLHILLRSSNFNFDSGFTRR